MVTQHWEGSLQSHSTISFMYQGVDCQYDLSLLALTMVTLLSWCLSSHFALKLFSLILSGLNSS